MMLWLISLMLSSSIFLIWYCPDAPLGKALRRYIVIEPTRWLIERERKDLIYFLIIAGFMAAGGEIIALAGP